MKCRLCSSNKDGEDLLQDLDIVSRQVTKCGETAVDTVERLSKSVEADIKI